MLLDFTSKEIEEGLHKLEMEKETVIAPEGQARKGARILGLQVMGVFTLCGLLATLGWGGSDRMINHCIKGMVIKGDQQQHRCIYQYERDNVGRQGPALQTRLAKLPRRENSVGVAKEKYAPWQESKEDPLEGDKEARG
jgi:hypothetical protein